MSVKDAVDAVDSSGGHILTSLVLIAMGTALIKLGIAEGRDMIIFALGLLGRSMVGQNGKKPQPIVEVKP